MYSSSSKDGILWDDKVNITGELPFSWDQKVSLYSFIIDGNGHIYVVFAENENRLTVFKSVNSGKNYENISIINSENAIVAPRIFLKESGGLILFATRKASILLEGVPSTLSIYFSESTDGIDWDPLDKFVENDNLLQSFLPYYTSLNGKEYVVFQAIISSVNFQLFMKIRDTNTGKWTDSKLLTDFLDPLAPDIETSDFDNQRPFIKAFDSHLTLVWERKEFGLNSRIYYTHLDDNGQINSEIEVISDDFRISAFPSVYEIDDEEILLWFDNRDGNRIILAQKKGIFWDDEVISSINGDSTYGYFVPYESIEGDSQLLIAWENISGERNRTVILNPDKSVNKPEIKSVNFRQDYPSSEEFPIFSWSEPEDSSFIRGYSYIWTQDINVNPEEKLDLRSDPLKRRASVQVEGEGIWYFKVIAQDYALNWSESAVNPFNYDKTPPQEVLFWETPSDPYGYALSNTFDLQWNDPPDEFIRNYYYEITYMGTDIDDSSFQRIQYLNPANIANLENRVSLKNLDNGYWAITVVAEDYAGNRSLPSIQVFRLNKYIPVTSISNVYSKVDELLRVQLTIRGRGFLTQGPLKSIIIDGDGKTPWDHQYYFKNGDYSVTNDRTVNGPIVDDIEGGIYFIAVEHPRRGIVFAKNQLKFESTGVVKFGDFSTDYKSIWSVIPYKVRIVSGNSILALIVLFLLGLVITISSIKIVHIGKEIKDISYNSKALFKGKLLSEDEKKERLKTMKRKGLGLRFKFLMALLSLVISVILMISISLGLYMINAQKENLATSMKQRAELLLETLVSGSENSLPLSGLDRSLGLNVLPRQISAMEEAEYATITGLGSKDIGIYNYIWATNDININLKYPLAKQISKSLIDQILSQFTEEDSLLFNTIYELKGSTYVLIERGEYSEKLRLSSLLFNNGIFDKYTTGGEKLLYDQVSSDLLSIEKKINETGLEIVGDIPSQIEDLKRRGIQSAIAGDLLQVGLINEDIRALSEQLDERLTQIANVSFVYPEFKPEELNRDQLNYIFYRPIVYQDTSSETFYRGTVRLGVSVEIILDQIDEIIINLIQRTVFISLAALALGVIGALFLANTMINPIRQLVKGVERIRDTEDKTKLKNQKILVKSKDELFDLANTVNQMTEGLVKAAIANQQLILGKEVQKKFIPLDPVPSGEDRKLSTGRTDNDKAEFFGYYEGAKGVSGDYFNYRQIDENHFACIKCDISGKDIPASLIMVEVATIFNSYIKNLNLKKDGIHLNKMVEDVNDLIEELNFIGKFAAFTIVLINIKTGKTWMSNAGDNIVHYFDASQRSMNAIELYKAPAAGPFSSEMVNMMGGFKQEIHTFHSGDILFLFTDGIEESQRDLRNENLEIIECTGCDFSGVEGSKENRETDTHLVGAKVEELGLVRIDAIANAILNGQKYHIEHNHNPFPGKKFSFNFSNCEDSIEDAVLGLLAVEKIFRMFPDPNAGNEDRILIDRKLDDFLKEHFDQYNEYFRFPVENTEFPEYIYYSHLKETAQYDDLTVLAIRKK